MDESILARFVQALATGRIRVIDLSQPLDGSTAVIQLPRVALFDQRGV